MMKKKSNIYNLTLIIIAFLISISLYNKLPDLMPMHWNISGEVNRYGSKLFAAFLPPVFMIVIWLGMLYSPKIDPKKANYSKFNESYTIISNALVTFFFVIHIVIIATSLSYNIPINKVIPFMVGILFIIIGNYLPKSKSNFFYGIKTPWTLTSEEVWKKTHRLGGKLFVFSGLIISVSSLLFKGNIQFIILLISVFIVGIIPIIASYFYSKNNIK
ncbi:SdpI family protein [Clostridium uliginosum]|uniref:Uncharacterized membrane protein n=1 Tax=Clostridium uliginosum TaxID=119641 RepID=A0A1I1JSX3_9CLOT|nr:SdpI family protein [Clostridium uliginosum]SFC51052.1 Uncharacterized membrane protein [Clostridium uliginosum]